MRGGEPCFRAIDTWSWCHKNVILTWRYLCQNVRCHFVACIATERFYIVTQPRFCENSFYVKLTTFSRANNIKFGTKMTTDSERSLKMMVRSRWTVFEILLMSAVIRIWKIWHENETTRYLENYKWHKLDQDHFGKLLWSSIGDI